MKVTKEELEGRMNFKTFDGHVARADCNSRCQWCVRRPVGWTTNYLNNQGFWSIACGDNCRWPTAEEAIEFAKTGPKKKHVFISKWALMPRGIIEGTIEERWSLDDEYPTFVEGVVVGFARREHIHETREEAVKKAEKMREDQIRFLNKQINQLQQLVFE